jgi:hypothetical protein
VLAQILGQSGVVFTLALLGAGAVVLMIVGFLMTRHGLSLRPVWWFAGLWLLFVVPQGAYHIYDATRLARVQAPIDEALDAAAAQPDGSQPLERLFGADVDPALVTDVRGAYGDVFAEADAARFAVISPEETALLARFPDARATERAWIAYLAVSGLRDVAEGDSGRGFVAPSAGGGRVYVLPMSRLLGVWTGPDDAAIRARMAAGGFAPPRRAPLAGGDVAAGTGSASGDVAPARTAPGDPALPVPVLVGGIVVLMCTVIVYFFKGAAWAGASPRAAVPAVAAEELRSRLLAINDMDVPFTVASSAGSNQVEVTWRYADAKWLDIARAHGMRRTHRIVLRLDGDEHVARATDYSSSRDWSAGPGGGAVQWRASSGITFFEVQHQRVFGLQVGADGRLSPHVSYSYTFDLQEMKRPLIDAVTRAGWDWRPVLWASSPSWLRWLTE